MDHFLSVLCRSGFGVLKFVSSFSSIGSFFPILACGILAGKDAADWILGRVHAFDVMGVFGVFGYFFFFLSPLLHVHWDFWMWEVVAPPDWRVWLGGVAILNVSGLLCFALFFTFGRMRDARKRTDLSG